MSDRTTIPLSPPNEAQRTTSGPSSPIRRAIHAPWPPPWRWISLDPVGPGSTVTVSSGAGAKTTARGVSMVTRSYPSPAGRLAGVASCRHRGGPGAWGGGRQLAPFRCFGDGDPLYERYHDEEWGLPVRDECALYERISLEAFQSGLSWLTILRKREGFRRAFAGFDPEIVATWDEPEVAELLTDTGIVRN